ncbi:unnamed protein product, partial [Lymnaea stagnalis]
DEFELKCRPDLSGFNVGNGTKYGIQIKVGNLVFNSTQLGLVDFIRSAAAGMSGGIVTIIILVVLIVVAVIILIVVMKRQRCGFFK